MPFFEDFYSKARSNKSGFKLSLPFPVHSAEMCDINRKHNNKMKVYTGLDLSF